MKKRHGDALSMTASDQDLHAWIDGELVEPERSEFAEAITACPDLAFRVRALRNLKALLQLAYAPGALPQENGTERPSRTKSHA